MGQMFYCGDSKSGNAGTNPYAKLTQPNLRKHASEFFALFSKNITLLNLPYVKI